MLKRISVLFLVTVLLVSFSVTAFAVVAEDNNAGVEILVEGDEDGTYEIHFLPAVNESAKDNPTQGGENPHPDNPLIVAGD